MRRTLHTPVGQRRATTLEKGTFPMTKLYRGCRDSEDGQILALVAAGLVVFMLMVGLVIDAGIGFRAKRDAQNVSDLGSMAGTKVIADHYLDGGRTGAQVYAAIDGSIAANGCAAASGCVWTASYVAPNAGTAEPSDEIVLAPLANGGAIPTGAQGVTVTTSTTPDTFFVRVAGINELNVNAPATAMTSQFLEGAPAGTLLPIGAFDADYEPGTIYELTEGEEGPGNFGWLTWNGANDSNTLGYSLCNPDNPAMAFPVWIEGAPGNMNAQEVRTCLDAWLGETVLIPIWAQTNNAGGSNLTYEVVTLAAFTLVSYDQHASAITGEFVEFYALPSVPAGYGAPPCKPTDPACNSRTNFIGLTR